MTKRTLTMAAGLAISLFAATTPAWADAAKPAPVPAAATGFKRTELQRHDLAVAEHEAVMARGELAPGGTTPRHTHPGDEVSYILSGEVTLEQDGKPTVTLKAGDTFFVPAGQVHLAKNLSKAAAVIISTYVVEKGKPLATPVK